MRDLTTGSLARHLTALAIPIALGSLLQTLRFLDDLYFVSRLGGSAVAGVSAVGTFVIFNIGCMQVLSVGTSALISHGAGRRDRAEVANFFHQSLSAASLGCVVMLVVGHLCLPTYIELITPDPSVRAAALAFLWAFLPGLALQSPTAVLLGVLRGVGDLAARCMPCATRYRTPHVMSSCILSPHSLLPAK